MEIKLYNTDDDDRVLNKTLELKYELEIDLKDITNVSELTIPLYEDEGVELDTINYVFIPDFKRYYFLRSYNMGPNNIYHLVLECDVIETYKEAILASPAKITRKIEQGDYMNIGGEVEVIKEIELFESTKGLKDEETIIFSTIGQDIGKD